MFSDSCVTKPTNTELKPHSLSVLHAGTEQCDIHGEQKSEHYYDRLQIPHVMFKSGIIPFSLFKSNHVHVFPTVVCAGGGGGEHICVYIYTHLHSCHMQS